MNDLNHYFETNQKLWDNKTPIHFESEFYNMEGFLKGESSLRKIELNLLPDLNGKSIFHAQCHFGQDTLSLERMGAKCVGLDFSQNAVSKAEKIRDQLGLKSKFVCSNILEADQHINEQFDIVFASYGVITWLPDLNKWAEQLSKRLKPGGKLYLVEMHPFLYMFDWDNNILHFDYFNSGEPEVEIEKGTYADSDAEIEMKEYFWMHSFSEIFQALISNNMNIDDFKEYDYSPYNIIPSMEKRAEQEYVYSPTKAKIPHMFSIVATKA